MRQTPAGCFETQLFHVVVLRSVKSIGSRALELWSKRFQQICVRQQFVLDLLLQRIKFRLEFRVEIHLPRHSNGMPLTAYVVNSMFVETGQTC